MWLSLALPEVSPHVVSCVAEEASLPTTDYPLHWAWTEESNGVQHDLLGAGPATGAGSHGCCIPVKDALTGERFCLKVPRGDAGEPVPRSHLQKEFELLKRLNHVNVVCALSWVNSREGDV